MTPPATPARLPVHLDLTGRRVLVVGAGPVAARRAAALAEAGAHVVVVAPDGAGPLPAGAAWHRREFAPDDLAGAWLVVSCTGTVDGEVARAAGERGVWCVRSDDAAGSAAWLPAVARVDDVVLSVSAGRDPRRATALRDALALAVRTGQAPLRRRRPGAGGVAFVPVPPAADLLSVRAARLLAAADLVVRPPQEPPVPLPGSAEQVTARAGAAGPLLVARAAAGQRVVRLARRPSAVELRACAAAGVAVEQLPGAGR